MLAKIRGNATSAAILDAIESATKQLGSYEIEEKKTCLHLSNGRAFLGVHPRSEGLMLTLIADKPFTSDRFKKVEQTSKSRYHGDIVVRSADEVDDEVRGWLADSYGLVSKA